jgi:hypothetical protein
MNVQIMLVSVCRPCIQKKERSVSFVSVLVIQKDWSFVQFMCGNCHKIIFISKSNVNSILNIRDVIIIVDRM